MIRIEKGIILSFLLFRLGLREYLWIPENEDIHQIWRAAKRSHGAESFKAGVLISFLV